MRKGTPNAPLMRLLRALSRERKVAPPSVYRVSLALYEEGAGLSEYAIERRAGYALGSARWILFNARQLGFVEKRGGWHNVEWFLTERGLREVERLIQVSKGDE